MSETTENLPAGTPEADDLVHVVIDGNSRRATVAQIVAAGATPVSPEPVLHSLRLVDIASRITPATSLAGDHALTIDVLHASNLTGAQLAVNGTVVQTFTDGTLVNGQNRLDFSIASGMWSTIIADNPSSLEFVFSGTSSVSSSTVSAPAVTVQRANVPAQERFYHGLSASNNPATIDVSTLASIDAVAQGSSEFAFSVGPSTAGQFVILLAPADRDLSELINAESNFSVLPIYTRTANVRVIGGQQYNSYTLGPARPNRTLNYRARLEA